MHVIGIDPGYGRMGFSAISVVRDVAQLLECGCLETSLRLGHGERLLLIRKEVIRLLDTYSPKILGIEKLFFAKNVTTALKVAEARGVILATAAERGVRVIECSPQEVKMAVTGYGNADKQQVQQMVKVMMRLKAVPKPDDAADAVAVALAVSRMA